MYQLRFKQFFARQFFGRQFFGRQFFGRQFFARQFAVVPPNRQAMSDAGSYDAYRAIKGFPLHLIKWFQRHVYRHQVGKQEQHLAQLVVERSQDYIQGVNKYFDIQLIWQ
jgi:hypothetical protein